MKNKLKILFWPAIVILYFVSRTVNLKIIPIFTDEAIYTYWAQIALNDPANRFISLEDGKQPLFIWLAAIAQKFVADPLVASRLISVFAGFGSLIGIYLLAKELFSERVAKLAIILYIILPLTLLYDRLALFDSLLTMFGIYSTYLTVKMIKDPRLDIALLNGFAIGSAMITKSSGNFFLYLLPFSLVLANFKEPKLAKKFIKWFAFSLITFLISQTIFNALRLAPLFYIISRKNLEFIRSYSEVLKNPFEFFISNFEAIVGWIITYIGLPLFIIFTIGATYGIVRRNSKIIYLLFLIFVPFMVEIFFNKVLYARFVLFYFPYLIIVTALALSQIGDYFKKYQKIYLISILLTLLIPFVTSFKLLTNPPSANIPKNDSFQYLNAWPAGYGVDETIQFLKKEKQNGRRIYVGTEGTFGLLPFALKIYFFKDNDIQIDGYWPVSSNEIPRQVVDSAKTQRTFFIFNETQKEIIDPHLKLIAKYQKGSGNSFMRLYEVLPPNE